MLRPSIPEDTDALVMLSDRTGVFKPFEIEALREVLDDYHSVNHLYGHLSRTWVENEIPRGFVYFAPTAMTDRTWELWWIVVDKSQHGRGLGGKMLELTECAVREQDARQLLIETSSTPLYLPTRKFYLKYGYKVYAEIPDFYADGDSKVIFGKRMRAAIA